MINVVAAGLAGGALVETAANFELGRGAIAGAFFVAAAFLAGHAVIRRSALAVSALLMAAAAGALQMNWLGLFGSTAPNAVVLLQGFFAAAVIIFLSKAIKAARTNAILGGAMFTAALVLAGMGVINLFDRVDIGSLMRWSVLGAGGFGVVLATSQALRGDKGAQLILPGAVLVIMAALVGSLTAGAFGLAPHGLFTLGILAASLVALTENTPRQAFVLRPAESASAPVFSNEGDHDQRAAAHALERKEVVIDSQMARLLDYAGVATWDWSDEAVKQTSSLPDILGADSTAPLTPDALRKFVHESDLPLFEKEVFGSQDGSFDVLLKLFDGRIVRCRGARASNPDTGALERIVAFVEKAAPSASAPVAAKTATILKPDAGNGVSDSGVRKATEAAIVPAAASMAAGAKLSKALDKGDIVAAFQPIVSLDDEKIAGYEALARWRDQEDGADEGPESFVKTAEAAGKGAALAEIMLQAAGAFLADKIKREKREDLFVTLNVSFGQMRDQGFANAVRNVIKKHHLPENALVLELTEADAVSDAAAAGKIFQALKKAGAALAFDDFGAGYSCLSNLHKFDFDYLKIDKSFVDDIEQGGDGAKIVHSLAGLGRDLGMKVIVEGVETKDAAAAAREIGCVYAQGFAFGKPVETGGKKTAAVKKADKRKTDRDLSHESGPDEDRKSGRWRIWQNDLR